MSTRTFWDGLVRLDRDCLNEALTTKLRPLPIGKAGHMRIKHVYREFIDVYEEDMHYDHTFDTLVQHKPNGEEYTAWMSATPQEFVTVLPALHRFASGGRAFMSGLGLGVVPRLMAHLDKDVSRFVVVEESQDVIDLVWPHVKQPGWEIVHGDIDEAIDTIDERFDLVLLDTWPAGDYLWLPWVESLARRGARLRANKRANLWLWEYDLMIRRLRQELRELNQMVKPGTLDPDILHGLHMRWPYFGPFVEFLNEGPHTRSQLTRRIKDEILAFRENRRKGLYLSTKAHALPAQRGAYD